MCIVMICRFSPLASTSCDAKAASKPYDTMAAKWRSGKGAFGEVAKSGSAPFAAPPGHLFTRFVSIRNAMTVNHSNDLSILNTNSNNTLHIHQYPTLP